MLNAELEYKSHITSKDSVGVLVFCRVTEVLSDEVHPRTVYKNGTKLTSTI